MTYFLGGYLMKPLNFRVIFEDKHILACYKPPQIATQSCSIRTPDMVSLAKNHLAGTKAASASSERPTNCSGGRRASSGEIYLGVIHRLDQPVGGILVFAKTPSAAKNLSAQLAAGGFGKYYRALVDGVPDAPTGTVTDYLVRDGRTNMSRICAKDTPGAKYASLKYSIVEQEHALFRSQKDTADPSLPRTELDICLDTGRHHQIRVQLAGLGCPIVGDAKYNLNTPRKNSRQYLCLCAYKLTFTHPKTNEPLQFELGTGYF